MGDTYTLAASSRLQTCLLRIHLPCLTLLDKAYVLPLLPSIGVGILEFATVKEINSVSRKSVLKCVVTRVFGLIGLMGTASSAYALPVIYNDSILDGRTAFDAAVTTAGGTVHTDLLAGLTSASSWARAGYSITSIDGSSRFIDSSYLATTSDGGASGDAIGINPYATASDFSVSGLKFIFDSPINAFGLEIGDWATCCYPSALYIAFDGGAVRQVAVANTSTDNPGYAKFFGFENFIGAVDDTNTFSSVNFYGDGLGEYLVAGGTIRYATVPEGSFTPVPEPSALALMGFGFAALGFARRRKG